MPNRLFALLALFLLAACASPTWDYPLHSDQVTPGMTKAEVFAVMGAKYRREKLADGSERLTWSRPELKGFDGKVTVTFLFDPAGRVVRKERATMGRGRQVFP